ncbi:cold-shock protein [Reyranella sp. CPCC 100927]|uniref:cold-shock protein n=1 Tax=Reyranella sp. CPCC 100927 TaxID=2599616 RepID=UPI0011B6A98A|nr:cold-shock protein [Reyranella sp. CPCC 100927]TWT11806.1 cold-shock protein [Reyranella sp. CPCC 100927]
MTTQATGQGSSAPETVEFRGRVKWFNATKGFGFVTTESGGGDAFLHITVLRQAGHEDIAPGVTLGCHATKGPKGLQVMRITSVDLSTAGPMPRPEAPQAPTASETSEDEADFVVGLVKWYNAERGYGFVCPQATDKDVFVHAATLRRHGIESLTPGQTVRVRVTTGPKGLQVAEIRLS